MADEEEVVMPRVKLGTQGLEVKGSVACFRFECCSGKCWVKLLLVLQVVVSLIDWSFVATVQFEF